MDHNHTKTNNPQTFEELLQKHSAWLLTAVNTAEASRILGIPIESLTTLRCRGGGPMWVRPEGTKYVRYFVFHLIDWALSGGIKRNTADDGQFIDLPLPHNDNEED